MPPTSRETTTKALVRCTSAVAPSMTPVPFFSIDSDSAAMLSSSSLNAAWNAGSWAFAWLGSTAAAVMTAVAVSMYFRITGWTAFSAARLSSLSWSLANSAIASSKVLAWSARPAFASAICCGFLSSAPR